MSNNQMADCERVLSQSRNEREMLSSLSSERQLLIRDRANLMIDYRRLAVLVFGSVNGLVIMK